jgi:PAS domain S-box-containing protein
MQPGGPPPVQDAAPGDGVAAKAAGHSPMAEADLDTFGRGRHRSWQIAVVLAIVTVCQLALAFFSIEVLSAVRSYVHGESLYSKGQKQAHIHLLDYLQSRDENDYRRFLGALAVPLGDRQAREQLDKPDPDYMLVRHGFLQGGNSPSDLDGLIWLYRWFHAAKPMADAISRWAAGDSAIQEMVALGNESSAAIRSGASASVVAGLRARASALNGKLTVLEREFSLGLVAASKAVQSWLLALNLVSAALLGLVGTALVKQRLRERAVAEAEINRRREFLQQLLDSTAEGLFGVDLQGRCMFINRSALRLLGARFARSIVGRDMHSLLHPAQVDGGVCAGEDCRLRNALCQQHTAHLSEEVFRAQDGKLLRVELWSHPLYDRGEVEGVVMTFFDIGEQVRIRDALRKSEARLAKLIDTVADAVIALDSHGRVVLANRAAELIFRAGSADLIGRDVGDLLEAFSLAHLGAMLEEAQAPDSGPPVGSKVHEVTGRRFDGEAFPAEVSVSAFESESGEFTTIILRDMSQQETIRREREARQQGQGGLPLAHEP